MQVRGAGRTARTADPDFGDVLASEDLARHVGWADHVVLVTRSTDPTRRGDACGWRDTLAHRFVDNAVRWQS